MNSHKVDIELKKKREAFLEMLKSEDGRATWSVGKHLEYKNHNKVDTSKNEDSNG